jgi:hypothetical protein
MLQAAQPRSGASSTQVVAGTGSRYLALQFRVLCKGARKASRLALSKSRARLFAIDNGPLSRATRAARPAEKP